MQTLFNFETKNDVRDHVGQLVLFERENCPAYGLLAKDAANRLAVTVLDGKNTTVTQPPAQFIPLPDARIELALPIAADLDLAVEPKVGLLVLAGRSLTLLTARPDSLEVGLDIELGEVSDGWPMGTPFHWRIVHPSASDDVVTLYDSRRA